MADTSAGRTKPTPWIELGARELRLLLVTLLAATYLAVWTLLRAPAGSPSSDVAAAPADTEGGAPAASATWIDQLPADQRPAVELPPGWALASPQPSLESPRSAVATPHPRLVHIARARVRTRSS